MAGLDLTSKHYPFFVIGFKELPVGILVTACWISISYCKQAPAFTKLVDLDDGFQESEHLVG